MKLKVFLPLLFISSISVADENQCDPQAVTCVIYVDEACRDPQRSKECEWRDGAQNQIFGQLKSSINKTLPSSETEVVPASHEEAPAAKTEVLPTAAQNNSMNQCQNAVETVESQCSADDGSFNLNYLRNTLDGASQTLLSASNATQNTCSGVSAAATRLNSAVVAWKNNCADQVKSCFTKCEAAISAVKNLSTYQENMKSRMEVCKASFSKVVPTAQRMADTTAADNALAKCQSDALAAQQGLQNIANPSMIPGGGSSPGYYPTSGSGSSPAVAPAYSGGGGSDRSEFARASGGGAVGAGLDGAPSNGTMDGKAAPGEYQKSVVGQFNGGGSGGGVNGKVTYSDSSGPRQNQQRGGGGGGGSSRSSTVNGGFYGGGASGSGMAFRQASIAPVGGYPASANSRNSIGNLKGKPDLRRFLPPGGPKRVAASPSGFDRPYGNGKDGLTGPRSNLFQKVSNRYGAHRANLIP